MARQPVFAIPLNRDLSTSLQDQLSDGLKERIRDGIIPAGSPLPSSRELARDLGVSRNTVVNAYDRLLGEGYLESRPRSGVFVNAAISGSAGNTLCRAGATKRLPTRTARRNFRTPTNDMKLVEPQPFRPCQPDVRLFPLSRWNSIRGRILRSSGTLLLNYQSRHPLGLPLLRQALASYLSESRGVRCRWEQIAITCGSQQALFLLGQLLLKLDDKVLIEDPGYVGARQAFELAGAKLIPMMVDEHGVVPPEKSAPAKIIYTTPSRQFPTGASLPVARRLQMLAAARTANAWLLEDDYDSEFRYSRPPLPSLHSLDSAGRVIYLGSMSKVLFPSLRIGYVVLPDELISRFESLRLIVEDHGPLIDQATLAEFIDSGSFYSHIRRCRKAYASRLEAFLAAMHRHKVPLDFPFTDGGMNQTGYLNGEQVTAERISSRLLAAGFDVPLLSRYSMQSPNSMQSSYSILYRHDVPVHRSGLVFGFTAFEPRTIQSAVARLAAVMHE
ncbi:MAG: PLP-dependent aminotransferase family protein [Planctomyces sp.]|nr:PLP-dependent aminotransferase family protein [Planctomyces sp.]